MRPTDPDSAESDRLPGQKHPRETATLVGHLAAETEMLEAFRGGRLPHAWLIGGPEGIGKATLAWRFARFVLANPDPASDVVRNARDLSVPETHPMFAQVAAGGFGDVAVLRREWNDKTGKLFSEIRVDEVRRASSMFQRASRAGGYRICILDSAEDLNRNSANALLKLIEEPPALCLFLVVAHRPGQLLPTIRSRCRSVTLSSLSQDHSIMALRGLGPPFSEMPDERLAEAATRGHHSVRGALHWLSDNRMSFDHDTTALLERLPDIDWRALHGLSDRMGSEPDGFDIVLSTVLDWLHARLRRSAPGAAGGPRRLAPLAEVWDKVRRSARDAETLNLDKRTILFSIFADLAQAKRSL